MALVGSSLRRKEDPSLLRGQGHYVEDVHLPGTLHMAVLRSPYPHARIDRITAEVSTLPVTPDRRFGLLANHNSRR